MLGTIVKLTVVCLTMLLSAQVGAQIPVRINWTAVTGAQSGMFMAQQEGLFKKNGLDVELLHIASSSRGIQAILAGEIAFSYMDGTNQVAGEPERRQHRLRRGRDQSPGFFPDGQTGVQTDHRFAR